MGVGEEWRWLYSPPTHARGGERQGPVKMNVMQTKDQKTYLMLYIYFPCKNMGIYVKILDIYDTQKI